MSLLLKYNLADVIAILTSKLTEMALPIVYMGIVPDFLLRLGIRFQLQERIISLRATDVEDEMNAKMKTIEALKTNPSIAIETDAANDQHYEVPAEFYDLCLGPRKKYSSGLWPNQSTSFEESEELMLDLYCKRAGVKDGMKIVDLGCGWGSLTLWLCEKVWRCLDHKLNIRIYSFEFVTNSIQMQRLQVFLTAHLSANSYWPMPEEED